MSKFWKTL